jgi:hypothetical protein
MPLRNRSVIDRRRNKSHILEGSMVMVFSQSSLLPDFLPKGAA